MLFGEDARRIGAALTWPASALRGSTPLLFGESQGRVVMAVDGAELRPSCGRRGRRSPAAGDRRRDRRRRPGGPTAPVRATWRVAELRRGWETSIEEAMTRPGSNETS